MPASCEPAHFFIASANTVQSAKVTFPSTPINVIKKHRKNSAIENCSILSGRRKTPSMRVAEARWMIFGYELLAGGCFQLAKGFLPSPFFFAECWRVGVRLRRLVSKLLVQGLHHFGVIRRSLPSSPCGKSSPSGMEFTMLSTVTLATTMESLLIQSAGIP